MAFRRYSSKRVRPIRRRRMVRRRVRTLGRPIRPVRTNKYINQIHYSKRASDQWWDPDSAVVAAGIRAGVSNITFVQMAFRLQDVPNYAEYVALFRYYKILGVKINFVCDQTNSVSDVNPMPTLLTYWNPEQEEGFPASAQDMREHSNCRRSFYAPNKRVATRYIKPRVAYNLRGGEGTVAYANTYKGWIPTSDFDMQHYGLMVCVDNLRNTENEQEIKTELTYYLAFKCTK